MSSARKFLFALIAVLGIAGAGVPAYSAPEPTEREQKLLELLQKPNSYFIEQLKNPPETIDGQVLHPKIQYYQEVRGRTPESAAITKKMEGMLDTAEGRAYIRQAVDRTWTYRTKVTEEMAKVEDRQIPGPEGDIHVRIYWPETHDLKPLPILVYYHGGAWLFGSVEAVDRAVRLIANEADAIVVSVDYRLTPDHPYPAHQLDAQAAFKWTVENAVSLGGTPEMVAVGGDSAGGQLSISTSLRQRDEGGQMPAYQLLYYPSTDMSTDYRSFELFGEGYGLNKGLADVVFAVVYPTEELRMSPDVSPLRAKSLAGLPATMVITPGFDMLRDQGIAFANRLEEEGVSVIYLNYESLTHGFMQHSGTIDDAERACVDTARIFGTAIRSRVRMKLR